MQNGRRPLTAVFLIKNNRARYFRLTIMNYNVFDIKKCLEKKMEKTGDDAMTVTAVACRPLKLVAGNVGWSEWHFFLSLAP